LSLWVVTPKVVGSDSTMCKACNKLINFHNMGIQAFRSHARSSGHKSSIKCLRQQRSMDTFVQVSTASTIDNDGVAVAEVLWALHVVEQHQSFESVQHLVDLFKRMFPDSKVPLSMTLGPRKLSYLLTDGVLPYVKEQLQEFVQNKMYTLQFDETNKGKERLAIIARYLDGWKLVQVLLSIMTLGDTKADTITKAILETTKSNQMKSENCVTAMSDSCNTMRGSKHGVVKQLGDKDMVKVDVGGCSLHHVHNAGRKGIESLPDGLETFIGDLFCLFRYSGPINRKYEALADLLELEQKKFLRHVKTRWLQILPVIQRILEQYDLLTEFFNRHGEELSTEKDRARRILVTLRDP
jgi:hypothetical protein